jgi:hypothetical protein
MDARCAMQKAGGASCRIERGGAGHVNEQTNNDTGEPDAVKVARPVRGGAVGNVPIMAARLPPTLPNMAERCVSRRMCAARDMNRFDRDVFVIRPLYASLHTGHSC